LFAVRFADVLTAAPAQPLAVSLGQNVPNPFNPSTTIHYTVDSPSRVVITVDAAGGQLVRRLDEGARAAGSYSARWNGEDNDGHAVASGVYFYRLEGAPGAAARKMVLIR
jgi:flagellar hook assembly protein FlgD